MSDDEVYIQTVAQDPKRVVEAIEVTDERRRTHMALEVATNSARIASLDKRMASTNESFERTLNQLSDTVVTEISSVRFLVWEVAALLILLFILYSLWPYR